METDISSTTRANTFYSHAEENIQRAFSNLQYKQYFTGTVIGCRQIETDRLYFSIRLHS